MLNQLRQDGATIEMVGKGKVNSETYSRKLSLLFLIWERSSQLKLLSLGGGTLLALLIARSLTWPLVMDAPLMHYIAWLITEGAVPYRDFFDMNFPGTYAIHLAVLATVGAGDAAWRMFDLSWLLATVWLVVVYCRGVADRWTAIAAGVLFALYHLAGGATAAGERDFLLCLFLVAAAYQLVVSWENGGTLRPLAWCGLALGAGITIKPFVGLFGLCCAAIAVYGAKRAGRSIGLALCSVGGAALILPAAAFGWVAWRGGFTAFVEILTNYLLPFYHEVGRASGRKLVTYGVCYLVPVCGFGWLGARIAQACVILGLLLLITVPRDKLGIRRGVALVGMFYGSLHYFVQGKNWGYHLYPLILFSCVTISLLIGEAGSLKLRRALALTFLTVLIPVLGVKATTDEHGDGGARDRFVEAVVQDLQGFAAPGATVQVMDLTDGGIHALLRLGVHLPTRFIYDFHFYHHQSDRRIQALRSEFVAGLTAGKPAAIVVFKTPWLRHDYPQATELLGVADLLTQHYALAIERDEYRLYARRSSD